MFVIEVKGRSIAVMSGDRDDVTVFSKSDIFRNDIEMLSDEHGRMLWDGEGQFDPLVRQAQFEEAEEFERSFSRAIEAGSIKEQEKGEYLAFLFKVHHHGRKTSK